jgi:hypothetical protein
MDRASAEHYVTASDGANREPLAAFAEGSPWYNPPAVRGVIPIGVVAVALFATGCGGGSRQDAHEPSGNFPMAVSQAKFPLHQTLAEKSRMTISVRNTGSKPIPNVAVTVTPAGEGTEAQAFAEASNEPGLADRSRPVWVIDSGPHGGVTAYSDTWALGQLPPGRTTTFMWDVTAVQPGVHKIAYRVAAGLNGKARAVGAGGAPVGGTFTVNVDSKPAQAIVTASGKVKRITAK